MKKIFTSLLLTAAACSWAQPVPDSAPNDHQLQIGLAAVNSQSIYLGGNSQTRVFPAIDYQYKRFYFQAGDIGFNLVDDKNWEVDFGLGVDLVGDVDRGDSPQLEFLPELSFPVSTFLSAQYKTKIGLFKLKYNHEINNKHDGNSASFSYSAPIRQGQWLIMPQLAYEHHSKEVVNYFYGVNPSDATVEIPAYQAGSVKNFQLSVFGLRPINQKWSFVANLQNEFYGNEISNSPIVDDDQRFSVFVGFLCKVF